MKKIYRYNFIVLIWSLCHAHTFFAIEYLSSNTASDQLIINQSTKTEVKTIAQLHIEDIAIQAIDKIQENFSYEQIEETKIELIHALSEYLNLTTEEILTLDNIIDRLIENYSTESFQSWMQTFSQTIIHFVNSILEKKLLTEYDYKVEIINQLTSKQLKNKDILIIVDQLAKLSQRSRPKNIQAALQQMHQGQIVRKAIKTGNFNSIIPSSLNHQEHKLFHDILTHANKPEHIAQKLTPESLQKIRDIYLTHIVDLQWYLYKKILLQKEGFFSGSITVYDFDEKIMKFLENYVKFINEHYNISGLSIRSIINNQAYNRSNASTHWWGKVARFPDTGIERIYGIDVKFDEKYNDYLPNNKNQLHFAYLDNGQIFIKWEKYGTTLNLFDQSEFWHIITALKNVYERLTGLNTPGFRDENQIPNNVLVQFKELINNHSITLTSEQKTQLNIRGIAGMRDVLSENSPFIALIFDNFLIHQKGYDPTSLSYRKGNEVILNDTNDTTEVNHL